MSSDIKNEIRDCCGNICLGIPLAQKRVFKCLLVQALCRHRWIENCSIDFHKICFIHINKLGRFRFTRRISKLF